MKLNLKKYLLVSTIVAVFSEAFFFRFIIDVKLFYIIILINYYILFRKQWIKANVFWLSFVLFMFIHGGFAYSILLIPPYFLFSQIIGITLCLIYYYSVLRLYNKTEILNAYLTATLIIAVIGFPGYFLGINLNVNNDSRFCSILTEPAHYAIIVLPACYYFLKSKKYLALTVVFISLILTESSIAYIGLALMFVLPNMSLKRLGYACAIVPVVVFSFYWVYLNNEKVKMRFDDTYESLKAMNTGKFKQTTNVSTYALLSNFYIAKLNFIDHPLGSGLGSHYPMYKNNYATQMRTPEYLKTLKLDDINSKDGASLFIRMFSEFGLFGLFFTLFILYYIIKSFKHKDWYFEQGIAIYLLLKLFRDGHYFPPEFYFFVIYFYFSITNNFFKTIPHEKHLPHY